MNLRIKFLKNKEIFIQLTFKMVIKGSQALSKNLYNVYYQGNRFLPQQESTIVYVTFL